MLFLIGLGHTLINRQRALVGARFAAFYYTGTDQTASGQLISRSIASPESWSLAEGEPPSDDPSRSEGWLVSAFNWIGGVGSVTYTTSATPTRGMLPRMYRLRTSGRYSLADDPWNCKKTGGTYLSGFTSGVPGLGPLLSKLSCCETYQNR